MIGLLETLVSAFGAGLGNSLPREVVQAIFATIAKSQLRKVWRRAIRDMAEDMVVEALVEHDIGIQQAKKYVDRKESYYKDEARNRFDHALQERD